MAQMKYCEGKRTPKVEAVFPKGNPQADQARQPHESFLSAPGTQAGPGREADGPGGENEGTLQT